MGEHDSSWMTHQALYRNPTIESLAQYICARLNDKATNDDGLFQPIDPEDNRIDKMRSLVQRYTQGFITTSRSPVEDRSDSKCIILTGSTGSLGQHLLRQILSTPQSEKAYCFDRRPDAENIHRDKLANYDNLDRVKFLQVVYQSAEFGLDASTYKELLNEVDTIIHAAWKVDFNHSLESFEPVHICGVRHFIDFSLQSPKRPHIAFVSSVSSVSEWPTPGNNRGFPVPDTFIHDLGAAQSMGYSESKLVAEHILHQASTTPKVNSTILRVCQIAGPLTEKGKWNEDEWVPALVKTSKAMGCLPKDLPDVDWIPVDRVASIVT